MANQISCRHFVRTGAAGALFLGCRGGDHGDEVAPGEDLMREHGVLARLIAIYEAAAAHIDRTGAAQVRSADRAAPPIGGAPGAAQVTAGEAGDRSVLAAVCAAARIAREFIEDYHEQLEEQYVFPRLERAGALVDLVAALRHQHDVGRALTDRVLTLASGAVGSDADRAALADALRGYGRMFVPHMGHEDTRVFPMFHQLAGSHYAELGEQFEAEEQRRFGLAGFERVVAKLPVLEAATGIADLDAVATARRPPAQARRP
jgi:hemerythrin-like domain-containing protein